MDASVGTPQTAFVADAARQSQYAQSFFYTLGDIFGGSDTSPRTSTNYGNAVDVAVDATGVPYVRGTTTPLITGNTANAAPVSDFKVSPAMLLAGALAVFLISRKSK